jgi:hypothetical protein
MTDIVWLPWFEQEGEDTELLIGRSNQRFSSEGELSAQSGGETRIENRRSRI